MSEQQWQIYEEVATYLIDQFAEQFGLTGVQGKQKLPGASGTEWEIDAKGCIDGDEAFLVVECKRHTTAGVSQGLVGTLAYSIHDTGAEGGIIVSPRELQDGAKKVAASASIIEMTLDADSTTVDYVAKFLDKLNIGKSVSVSASISIEVRDSEGNIVDTRDVHD